METRLHVSDFETDIVFCARTSACSADAPPDVELVYFPEAWRGEQTALILRHTLPPQPPGRFVEEAVVTRKTITYRCEETELIVNMPGGTALLDPQDVLEAWERTRESRVGKTPRQAAGEIRRSLQPDTEFFAFDEPIVTMGHSLACPPNDPPDREIAYRSEDWGGGNVSFTLCSLAENPEPGYFAERILVFADRMTYVYGDAVLSIDVPNARFIQARQVIEAWDRTRQARKGKTRAVAATIVQRALTS
jgi:hypothetical protein